MSKNDFIDILYAISVSVMCCKSFNYSLKAYMLK